MTTKTTTTTKTAMGMMVLPGQRRRNVWNDRASVIAFTRGKRGNGRRWEEHRVLFVAWTTTLFFLLHKDLETTLFSAPCLLFSLYISFLFIALLLGTRWDDNHQPLSSPHLDPRRPAAADISPATSEESRA